MRIDLYNEESARGRERGLVGGRGISGQEWGVLLMMEGKSGVENRNEREKREYTKKAELGNKRGGSSSLFFFHVSHPPSHCPRAPTDPKAEVT